MPQHQRPDLSNFLRRRFDIVGPAIFDTVAPEIVPVLPLNADAPALFGFGRGGVTGGAGARAKISIGQPDIAGLVTLVHQVELYSSTAQQLHLTIHDDTSAFAAVTTIAAQRQLREDGRILLPQSEIKILSTGALLGTIVYSVAVAANESIRLPLEVELSNPWALVVNAETDATFVVASFLFSERRELAADVVP